MNIYKNLKLVFLDSTHFGKSREFTLNPYSRTLIKSDTVLFFEKVVKYYALYYPGAIIPKVLIVLGLK